MCKSAVLLLVNHWIAVHFYAEKLAFVVDLDNQCKVNRPWFINLTDAEDSSVSKYSECIFILEPVENLNYFQACAPSSWF